MVPGAVRVDAEIVLVGGGGGVRAIRLEKKKKRANRDFALANNNLGQDYGALGLLVKHDRQRCAKLQQRNMALVGVGGCRQRRVADIVGHELCHCGLLKRRHAGCRWGFRVCCARFS
jgi:hypothetical protein